MIKYLKKEEIDDGAIFEVANALKKGKIVVFPTDTVYGIGTNAYDKDACERIYEVKGRPKNKPFNAKRSGREYKSGRTKNDRYFLARTFNNKIQEKI